MMKRIMFTYAGVWLSLISCTLSARATPQDGQEEIFPATPEAQSAINWADGYFRVNGQPTFIASGSIHYARVPRELWRDRIWRVQQMGFNCVQSYVFWNASEPKEGQWDFTDNVDLDAWLALLQQMNMYALVRVGPYACAEWEEGGYPAWLTVKPGMIQREMGPSLPYSDAHLKKVEEITAKHQVNRGGNVFLVQIENEHSRGWGTQTDDPYLKYLDDQARKNGIEVAMFNSGLHHSQEPSGEVPFPVGPSPWYSTEFWTGWIGKYGEMSPETIAEKTRGTWKIIAFGGAGFNNYMVHGGTNFGYSGDTAVASYDYSAAVGEAGQLRGYYFFSRRAALFAKAFNGLLTGSHNDPDFAKCDRPELRVTTRTNPTGGSITFIDHFLRRAGTGPVAAIPPEAGAYHAPKDTGNAPIETRVTLHLGGGEQTVPQTVPQTVAPSGSLKVYVVEPRTIISNLPWTQNATFRSVCSNVLYHQELGNTQYWVVYGDAGDSGGMLLSYKLPTPHDEWVPFTYPADHSVQEIHLHSGDGRDATVLVMNKETSNLTWLVHDKLYVGASFVLEDGSVEFPTTGGSATVYSAAGKSQISQPAITVPALPPITSWAWRDAVPERAPDFKTDHWLTSAGPQAMESYDSFQNRYGWYRTVMHRDTAGTVSLQLSNQSGTFVAFLNGEPAAEARFAYGDSATLTLPNARAGDNTLAILVKAAARPKTTYPGPVGMRLARGIWGGISYESAPTELATTWKKWDKPNANALADDLAKPEYDDTKWTAVDVSSPAPGITISRGNSWYRGSFTLTADQVDSIIRTPAFVSLTKDARGHNPAPPRTLCYINGQLLNERTQDASKFMVAGKNTVLVEVQSRLGNETGSLELLLCHNSPLTKATWYFHGGLNDLDETAIIGRVSNWSDFLAQSPWQSSGTAGTSQPIFWKCSFTYHADTGMRETIGLQTDGLKAGHVWLNGHNLGESPQTNLMYVPECWLKDGENNLVIFDIEGAKPDQVKLTRYETFATAHEK